MVEAEELVCGRCGAALPSTATRGAVTCPYCGATAAPVPRVVERVVERVVVVSGEAAPAGVLRCSRCGSALRDARDGDVSVSGCASCGGVFIDRESLRALGSEDRRAERLIRQVVGAYPPARILGNAPDLRPAIGCPRCARPMARTNVQFTQVDVDLCDAHGAWFDWGEIAVYMHPPTDDPSRELTDEELAAAGISGAASHENDGFFGNLKRLLFGD